MDISGIPYGTLLRRSLRFLLNRIPSGTIVPILQGNLRGKKWIVGSFSHGCWLGSYEYQKLIVFEKTITGSILARSSSSCATKKCIDKKCFKTFK